MTAVQISQSIRQNESTLTKCNSLGACGLQSFGSRMSRSILSLAQIFRSPSHASWPQTVFVFAPIICILFAAGHSTSANGDDSIAREPLPKAWQADAELTDVFFVDENLGWAVGESGVTLRTRDGGNTWNAQARINSFRKDTVQLQPVSYTHLTLPTILLV